VREIQSGWREKRDTEWVVNRERADRKSMRQRDWVKKETEVIG